MVVLIWILAINSIWGYLFGFVNKEVKYLPIGWKLLIFFFWLPFLIWGAIITIMTKK